MLSHNNVASNVLIAKPRVLAVHPNMDYRVLSFLPVCHIFERMLHYLYMYMGAQIHFGESLETIKDLNHTNPSCHGCASFAREILRRHRGQRTCCRWREVGHLQLGRRRGFGMGPQQRRFLPTQAQFAKLVFGKVKEALGLSGIQAGAQAQRDLNLDSPAFSTAPDHSPRRVRPHGNSPVVSVNTTNGENMLKIGSGQARGRRRRENRRRR